MIEWRDFMRLWDKFPPCQYKFEFYLYLQFCQSYFQMRGVDKPIVVEIGVKDNVSYKYYEKFLNAEYYGVDVVDKCCDFVVTGLSQSNATMNKIRDKLDGRNINLLFIDGDHRYPACKADYELWKPLVENIIGFHDINTEWNGVNPEKKEPSVGRFWNELYANNKALVSFKIPGTFILIGGELAIERYYETPGIGVELLDIHPTDNRWVINKKQFEQRWGKGAKDFPLAPFHHSGGLQNCESSDNEQQNTIITNRPPNDKQS